jgi:hypothetical protein
MLGRRIKIPLVGGRRDGSKVEMLFPPPTNIHMQRNDLSMSFTESLIPVARGPVEMDTYALVQNDKTGALEYVLDNSADERSRMLEEAGKLARGEISTRGDKLQQQEQEVLDEIAREHFDGREWSPKPDSSR